MLKKRPVGKKKLRKSLDEDRAKKYLPRKYWDGNCSRYGIVYLDQGDGEQYPIPSPVGELVNDLLQDITRLERALERNNIKPLPLRVMPSLVRVKDYKRVPLNIRVYLDI